MQKAFYRKNHGEKYNTEVKVLYAFLKVFAQSAYRSYSSLHRGSSCQLLALESVTAIYTD